MFQTEKLLKEQGDKVAARRPEKIEDALKALKDALAGTDIEAVKRGAREPRSTCSQEFAQRLYAARSRPQHEADGGARRCRRPGAPAPNDDEVADAEIVDEPGEQISVS